ncbi:hypothetical protein [Flavobacterium subsaxonicum]|uniref:Adhesin domain-containing protein n=1 Tax=Flavobacterium subsaxonicum WB 4.1-42 = DSM 21790 TaxID=1121898 RepID=A0A0A2MZB5_9FLAO|nr:hypothetical protein [Flavobacterium subsaxonicum]KGO93560.1 hypothetical protein Q766_06220 [Flavobacterium subsaxonicum WB 4.1-42 = DSM 21790]
MKTIRLNIVILLLFLIPGVTMAGIVKGKYTKEKKINKSFSVNSTAGLTVSNKYGNIYITTWDEDKTAIDVVVTVSGNDEDEVNKRLNSIDVDFNATAALVNAKTLIGNFKGKRISMEINYTIKIPKRGTLGLANQYGGIMLGKINGGVNINCQYGSLDIEELNAENNNIDIQYCSTSKIGYIKAGNFKAQYSNINIAKTGKLILNADYTPFRVGIAEDINYKVDYGDIKIDSGDKINGASNYTVVRVGRVSNVINLTSNYGDISITNLEKSAKNVAINTSYGSASVKYDADATFDFEFYLDYAGLSGKDGLKFTEKTEKNTSSHYKGYYRSTGGTRIYIKSEYGGITLRKGE